MNFSLIAQRYGGVELSGADITGVACSSIDLRVLTGAPADTRDETVVVPPGTFRRAVIWPVQAYPVGEIRVRLGGRDVAIVAELTGRAGVAEITPEHLQAAAADRAYLDQLQRWLFAEH